MDSVKLEHNRY